VSPDARRVLRGWTRLTRASPGIGFEISRGLALASGSVHVLLGSRDEAKGREAARRLRAEGGDVSFVPCDVESDEGVARLAALVDAKAAELGVPGLSVLVNNAGMAFTMDDAGAAEAQKTLAVNVDGVERVTRALLPSLERAASAPSARAGSVRIVNVASQLGALSQLSPALQRRFSDAAATHESTDALLSEFVTAVRDGDYAKKGWPRSSTHGVTMYAVSKVGTIAHTFVHARRLADRGILVHAVCPGYCATDLTNGKGTRSPAEGAETPVWLAVRDLPADANVVRNATGGFWFDKRQIGW